jgi:hypothetical protein
MSQRGIRQIDGRATSRVVRVASQPDVDLMVDPETTNIKLVARWREICNGRSHRLPIAIVRPSWRVPR